MERGGADPYNLIHRSNHDHGGDGDTTNKRQNWTGIIIDTSHRIIISNFILYDYHGHACVHESEEKGKVEQVQEGQSEFKGQRGHDESGEDEGKVALAKT